MNVYLLLKRLHVPFSVVLVGTGFGSAYFMFFANRSANPETQAEVARPVVRADWWFTTPAGIWVEHADTGNFVFAEEPETSAWLRLEVFLLSPFVRRVSCEL